MDLPDFDIDGRLPPGRHKTDWSGLHSRSVQNCENQHARETLFSAVRAYANRIGAVLPESTLLIGGAMSESAWNNLPATVVIVPRDTADLRNQPSKAHELRGLLSLRDVIVGGSRTVLYIDTVDPLGGVLKAMLGGPKFLEAVVANNPTGYAEITL